MAIYAQIEMLNQGVPASKLSIAGVLRAFRRMLRDYLHPADQRHSLCALVRHAVIDDYPRRNKASRHKTRRKYDPPPGPPETRTQIRLAKRLVTAARNG
jgi:hypothetical protein